MTPYNVGVVYVKHLQVIVWNIDDECLYVLTNALTKIFVFRVFDLQ